MKTTEIASTTKKKNSSNSQKKSFFPNYFVMHEQESKAEAKCNSNM